jgi:hypothetical protein
MGSCPSLSHTFSGRKAGENLNQNFIGKRFPHRNEIIAVVGVAVFVCFSWTIIGFINKLSSFILYFSRAEITAIFAYMMAFALLESLTFTGLVVLVSAVLPSSWLKEGFAFKGFIITIVATITAILFQHALRDDFPPMMMLLASSIIPLLVVAILIFLIHSMPRVQNIVLNIQDRLSILLFIYVPLGFLSLIIVLYRNLL